MFYKGDSFIVNLSPHRSIREVLKAKAKKTFAEKSVRFFSYIGLQSLALYTNKHFTMQKPNSGKTSLH
ncbi:hypothetical protein CJ195_22430 [Bacillus sp. UMB0899]|nr:hypothetical protein CJ195_22430 [Bacillus sp. UMB0899]